MAQPQQNTLRASQNMLPQKTSLLQSSKFVQVRDIAMVTAPPVCLAFMGTRMVQNNKSVMDFLNEQNLPAFVPRDPRVYLGLNCAAIAPIGAATYIIWKTGGFDWKDTRLALSLLGATGLCCSTLVPAFMNKSLKWITVNSVVLAALSIGTSAAFWKIETKAGALMAPLAIWGTFCAFNSALILKNSMNKD